MRGGDGFRLAWGALREHRLRTALSMLGVAIGITAVILLTSIGEGARQFVLSEFTQFGTNMFQICLLYTSPSPRDLSTSRMPSSA